MGYYGQFSFSLEIPGSNVAACEAALRATNVQCEGDNLPDILASIFNDSDAYFDKEPTALEQLADAANAEPSYSDVTWEGYSHQKWRQYAEDTFEAIAPFVKSGGVVEVQGEEGEQCRWVFENGQVTYEQSHVAWPPEQRIADANERIVLEIVQALSEGEDFSPALIIREHRPTLWLAAKQALLADG